MTPAELRRGAAEERERRIRSREEPGGSKFDPHRICHPKQAAFVLDTARNVACLKGRQAGGSFGAALIGLRAIEQLGTNNAIYVSATRATVKKMAFKPALEMVDTNGLAAHPDRGELSIGFGKSTLYFMGADDEKTVEKLRGTPDLVLVIIDEIGRYKPDTLRQLIGVVRPGLRPRAGRLVLCGSPPATGEQGYVWDLSKSEAYSQHRFDYTDNDRLAPPGFTPPYLCKTPEELAATWAAIEALIDEDLRAEGETRESAWYLREYKAKFAVDLADKVYKLTEANLYDTLPANLTTHVVATDIGVDDGDGIINLGWADEDPTVYAFDEDETKNQTDTQLGVKLTARRDALGPIKMPMDSGGMGKRSLINIKASLPGLPIEAAEKPPVAMQVRAVNDRLRGGRLKVKRGSKLAAQLATPTWVDRIVGGKIDEHGTHSNLVPAMRYGVIAARRYLPEVPPDRTPEEEARERYLEGIRRAERNARASSASADYDPEEFALDLDDDLDGGFE